MSIRALEARVVTREATVQPLREQLQQDSRPSSRPPSSDPPQARAKRPRGEAAPSLMPTPDQLNQLMRPAA